LVGIGITRDYIACGGHSPADQIAARIVKINAMGAIWLCEEAVGVGADKIAGDSAAAAAIGEVDSVFRGTIDYQSACAVRRINKG
jgi:hypothetical protein